MTPSERERPILTDAIVNKAWRAMIRGGPPGNYVVGCTPGRMRAALEAVAGDIIELFGASEPAPVHREEGKEGS